MRNAGGWRTITEHDGRISAENDTITCCHCNGIVIVKNGPDAPMPCMCLMCMKRICEACEKRGKCTPFEQRLERMERRASFRRALTG